MSDKATVEINGVPLEVEFTYQPFHRGSRDSFGAPIEPDEAEDIDIEEIYLEGWEILCLMDDKKIDKARELVLKQRGE